jgi:hypothetical protein
MTNIVTEFLDTTAIVTFSTPSLPEGTEVVSHNVVISFEGAAEGSVICTASPCTVPISAQDYATYEVEITTSFAQTTTSEYDIYSPTQEFVYCSGADASNALSSAIDAVDSAQALLVMQCPIDLASDALRYKWNYKDLGTFSALTQAINRDMMQVAERLIELGADVSERDATNNFSVIEVAAIDNLQGYITLLVENGVDVDQRDPRKHTAIHHAAYWDSEKTAQELCDLGADMNTLN